MDGVDSFVQNPHYENGRRGLPVVAIVVHSTEGPPGPDAAENTRSYLNSVEASVQAIVDQDSIAGNVDWCDTAWHTGAGAPWNQMIEGVEHVGYAGWGTAEWMSQTLMLERSARLFAWRCRVRGIPPRKIGPDQLARAIHTRNPADGGICGHIDITHAAGVVGGHWDPGPNFPWDYYISRVRSYYDSAIAVSSTTQETDDMPWSEADLRRIIREEAGAAASDVADKKLGPWLQDSRKDLRDALAEFGTTTLGPWLWDLRNAILGALGKGQ